VGSSKTTTSRPFGGQPTSSSACMYSVPGSFFCSGAWPTNYNTANNLPHSFAVSAQSYSVAQESSMCVWEHARRQKGNRSGHFGVSRVLGGAKAANAPLCSLERWIKSAGELYTKNRECVCILDYSKWSNPPAVCTSEGSRQPNLSGYIGGSGERAGESKNSVRHIVYGAARNLKIHPEYPLFPFHQRKEEREKIK
jgi:hypothetical protein